MTKAKARLHKGQDNTGRQGVYLAIEANQKLENGNFIGDNTWLELIYIAKNTGETKEEKMQVLKDFKAELLKKEKSFELELTDQLKKLKEMV